MLLHTVPLLSEVHENYNVLILTFANISLNGTARQRWVDLQILAAKSVRRDMP